MTTNDLTPNLFVIGAMKCGTSSFHRYLDRHPEIVMSTEKEPCHFTDPKTLARQWPQMSANDYHDPARYAALFPGGETTRWRGESSTEYSKWPMYADVPERIHAASPDARFFYVVRDPVERALSHYLHNRRIGRDDRPMRVILDRDGEYRQISDYATQLKRFLRLFDAERVRIVRSEALLEDTAVTVADSLAWLGLDPSLAALDDLKLYHVTPDVIRPLGTKPTRLERLLTQRRFKSLRRLLPKRLREEVRVAIGAQVRRDMNEEIAMRARLRDDFAPMVEAFEALTGLDFSSWRNDAAA